jgi:hypothetical protein
MLKKKEEDEKISISQTDMEIVLCIYAALASKF